MTKVSDYIQENSEYLGDAAAALSDLSDEQFDAIVDIVNKHGYDGDDFGMTSQQVVITGETVGCYKNSRQNFWTEKGSAIFETFVGREASVFENLQMYKGQRRVNALFVFDLGDKRLTLVM